MNTSVVDAITIGDDVVIVANSFVNYDILTGSIVIRNQGTIHERNSLLNRFSY